jgi:hypothetical protein
MGSRRIPIAEAPPTLGEYRRSCAWTGFRRPDWRRGVRAQTYSRFPLIPPRLCIVLRVELALAILRAVLLGQTPRPPWLNRPATVECLLDLPLDDFLSPWQTKETSRGRFAAGCHLLVDAAVSEATWAPSPYRT